MLPALTRLALEELGMAAGGISQVHRAIADRAFPSGTARLVHDGISGAVYAGVQGGAVLAGRAAHALLPEREVSPALLGVLNGLRGDALEPPLAIPMRLSVEGAETPRLAIFVHGLFETEHAWRYGGGPRYGDRLPGWTPVYVRYNTGRAIAENGRELAEAIEALVADREVEEIALIGHSMGGLVACSACHAGGEWSSLVTHVITLGSPHTGAPLESAVHHAAEVLGVMPESRAFASLLRRRSAGIRDLRRGLDGPLHESARHCFVSATVTRDPGHPVARVVGDWLVLEKSASHRTQEPFHVGSTHHLALLNHPAVYERLAAQLG
jgi:pimeloyl-ACP methyl ester carboxylesterase